MGHRCVLTGLDTFTLHFIQTALSDQFITELTVYAKKERYKTLENVREIFRCEVDVDWIENTVGERVFGSKI